MLLENHELIIGPAKKRVWDLSPPPKASLSLVEGYRISVTHKIPSVLHS